jgi:hypothetical protein
MNIVENLIGRPGESEGLMRTFQRNDIKLRRPNARLRLRMRGYHAAIPVATSRLSRHGPRLHTDEGCGLPYIAFGGMKGAVFPCELWN